MTERKRRVSPAAATAYGVAIAVALFGLVMRAVAAHADGFSWVDVVSVLGLIVAGCLGLMIVLFEWFAWLDRIRTRTLAEAHPNAFIVSVSTDPALVSSADAFALQSTGKRTRLVASAYMTLVADRDLIRFFRGAREPREVAAFRTSVVVGVEIGSAQTGARIVPTLDLVCTDGLVRGRITVHLMRFGRVLPRFVRDEQLERAVGALRTVCGIRGDRDLTKEV
ncbi:hypothetical protein ACFRFH_14995 [Leifsonia sp. NPDC056824]|uniref:hypothetical protein n=1 Tax=Leifsonia sp. NPDC056824 TaxID=3345953 RepID=UPI0036C5EE5B